MLSINIIFKQKVIENKGRTRKEKKWAGLDNGHFLLPCNLSV